MTAEAVTPTGSRYDAQVAVFGHDVQKKIEKLRWFIVSFNTIQRLYGGEEGLSDVSTYSSNRTISFALVMVCLFAGGCRCLVMVCLFAGGCRCLGMRAAQEHGHDGCRLLP